MPCDDVIYENNNSIVAEVRYDIFLIMGYKKMYEN